MTTCSKQTVLPSANTLLAFLVGATAGIAVGIRLAPQFNRALADTGRAVDDFVDAAKVEAESVRTSVSNLADRGIRAVQKTNAAAADRINSVVSGTVAAGAKDAHGAIDSTVAAVNSGARKSHEAVDTAADAIRTGLRA